MVEPAHLVHFPATHISVSESILYVEFHLLNFPPLSLLDIYWPFIFSDIL